jgi:hypothetical protein
VPDSLIDYPPALIGVLEPIQFYSCFISYSTKDAALARRLHADLQSQHVRVWFAPEDLKIGDKIRTGIDESIRVDNAIMEIAGGWPELIRNTRNIGDFQRWKQHDAYQKAFARLLRDLRASEARP